MSIGLVLRGSGRWPIAALALAGCGAPTSYMGVDLQREPVNVADVMLRDLARRAAAGDKAAQLQLGRRSEAGDGVPADLDRACRLYAAAAATTGGTIYVYQPPVGKGAGRVVPITTPVSHGLPAARERLETLRYRAARQGRVFLSRCGTLTCIVAAIQPCYAGRSRRVACTARATSTQR